MKKRNGVTLEFYKLNYSVDVKGGKQRRLLHNVYGYCTPGMMVALMGATGAGKVYTESTQSTSRIPHSFAACHFSLARSLIQCLSAFLLCSVWP